MIRRIAHGVADLVFRDVDVRLHPGAEFDGPTIVVSNHFGGLADAILILDCMPRTPRIVARDVIWKLPIAGQVMRAIKGIPVHRRADGDGGTNRGMFDSCFDALLAGDVILIFPEGVTQEAPHIAPIKTGAARMALGAIEKGVTDLQIVPVGVHYADKAGFRNSVLVNVGAPIDVETWVAREHADPVHELTADIEAAMRAAAPDFPDWETARGYGEAAEVLLHDVDAGWDPLRYGDRALLADRLAARPADVGAPVAQAGLAYRGMLNDVGADDLPAARRQYGILGGQRGWLLGLFVTLLLAPYALVGLALVAVPWLIIRASRFLPVAPAVHASITPALATLAFGWQWLWLMWRGWQDYHWLGLGFGVALPPFFAVCTIFLGERLTLLWRRWRVRPLRDGPTTDALLAARAELSASTWGLL